MLNRKLIQPILMELAKTQISASPIALPRSSHLEQLKKLAGSDLERNWLKFVEDSNLRLPSHGQFLIEKCKTRPDFFYSEEQAAIYIDGPHHQFPERKARDIAQTTAMEDRGYTVIRFDIQDDWEKIIQKFPNIFGKAK